MTAKYKVGMTFGVFDLFHIGHLQLLKNAKAQCEKLIVCISDDEYVYAHKKKEPIISLFNRGCIVGSIKFVDDIDIQSLIIDKKELIEKHKPDVLFVGDDWTPETYSGEGCGVPVAYLPHTSGVSSTEIVKMVKES